MRIEHKSSVVALIRFWIDQYDEYWAEITENAIKPQSKGRAFINGMQGLKYRVDSGARYSTFLGSKQKTLRIQQLLKANATDIAFMAFSACISHAIQALSSVPEDTTTIDNSHKVSLFVSLMLRSILQFD
jgi:hypothetical protein